MIVTEDMKVRDALKINEHMLDAFVWLGPEFERLRRPALRKLLAGRVSVAQAARIAGLPLAEALYVLNLAASAEEQTISAELHLLPQRAFECRAENPPRKPRELAGLADTDARVVFVDVTPHVRHEEPAAGRHARADGVGRGARRAARPTPPRSDPAARPVRRARLRELGRGAAAARLVRLLLPPDGRRGRGGATACPARAGRPPGCGQGVKSARENFWAEDSSAEESYDRRRAAGVTSARGRRREPETRGVSEMIGVEQLKRVQHSEVRGVNDPLALLVECHAKIERHLDALARAGEVLRGGSDAERASAFFAIDMARAHFAGPLVKHTEDEEHSLFPRLRRSASADARAALSAVAELEAQHREADALHAEFERLAASLPRGGDARGAEAARLDETIAALRAHYLAHIAVENGVVFPAAARALTAEDLRQFAEEVRARRGVALRRR